jgi:hypothetical protein
MDPACHFDLLLQTAAAQPHPQRLLFVFASAELPDDATPRQRRGFECGEGGVLEPLMCVDKRPDQLTAFEALVAESRAAGPEWHVVFAAGLSGRNGEPPSEPQIEQALQTMVHRVRGGRVEDFLALDRSGHALIFG